MDRVSHPGPSTNRYSATARHLHWTVAAMVALAYALILSTDLFSRSADEILLQSHFWTGIAVLLLTVPWLIARWRRPPPPLEVPLPPLLSRLSRVTHWALYAFLLAQPLLGVFTVWFGKGAIPVPGLALSVPSPVGESHAIAHTLESIHKTLGNAFYYVIGLHIAAVLWHQLFRRDNLLKRMW